MTGTYLTDMADVLRRAGLNVIEQPGWQTRARSSGGYQWGPWCVVWHHAASAVGASGLSVADYGSYFHPYRPVQNLALGHQGEVIVCAAGATNTNGEGLATDVSRGTIPANSMNLYAIGIEAANNGVGEPWPQDQIDAYFAMTNALTKAYGMAATDVTTHAAYAPTRKIDPATAAAVEGPWKPRSLNSSGTWSLADIRAELADRAIPGGGGMLWSRMRVDGSAAVFMGWSDGRIMPQAEWVNGNDQVQLARYLAYEALGFGHELQVSVLALRNVCLLGALPAGDPARVWTHGEFGNVVP